MNTMQEVHDFIKYSALVDLPLRGGDFTWSRSGGDAVLSRLDRFLVGGAISRLSSKETV